MAGGREAANGEEGTAQVNGQAITTAVLCNKCKLRPRRYNNGRCSACYVKEWRTEQAKPDNNIGMRRGQLCFCKKAMAVIKLHTTAGTLYLCDECQDKERKQAQQ